MDAQPAQQILQTSQRNQEEMRSSDELSPHRRTTEELRAGSRGILFPPERGTPWMHRVEVSFPLETIFKIRETFYSLANG